MTSAGPFAEECGLSKLFVTIGAKSLEKSIATGAIFCDTGVNGKMSVMRGGGEGGGAEEQWESSLLDWWSIIHVTQGFGV